jgi:hypothetical protein
MAAGNPYLDDAPATGGNPYLDDTPAPAAAPAKPAASWGFADYATDGVRSLLNGFGKGVAGVAGLPADALRLGQAGLDYSQSVGQGRDYEAVATENRNRGAVGIPDVVAQRVAQGARTLGSENIQANLPTQYEPQSRAGKVISEAANFATQGAALPFGMARGAASGVGALAGVGSEVAGQATEGTAAEPYARLAGAIAAPLGVAAAQIPGAAQRAVVREAGAVPQAELSQILSQAQGLLDTAARNGTKLSTFQAIDRASGGRMNLSEIQRQAEGMGRLRGFFADMGDTNREAAGRQFARVGEESDSALGGRVAQAADVAIQRTPEGARLNQAQAALGPRVEAREAGEAMRDGLLQTETQRRAERAAIADPLYDRARNATASVEMEGARPPNPVDPVARRMSENPETLPGRPDAPIIRGQVDPTEALAHINEAMLNAKGDQLRALREARATLFDANGGLDLTSAGNMAASRAIQSIADRAAAAGDNTTARLMGRARDALGGAMESTPEIATANRAFAQASRPLDNFDSARPVGRIVERDRASGRPAIDAENVPGQIQGSTGAREFNEAATPAAREAYRGRLITQMIDEAGGREATGDAIRATLTKNADLLREHPGVVARLTARAEAEEGMTAVRNGPLGRLVDENQTASEAASKLFPTGQAAQDFSPEEVGRAVGALAAENPRAAGSLVRTRLQGAFDSVARDVNTAGGQMGAARFRNAIYGNTREAEHIRAAVRALPDGDTVLNGLDRLFDVFQAQGLRQNVGSKTAYNQQFLEEASKGGTLEGVAKAAINPIRLPSRFGKMIEEWRLGRNMDQIAALATSSDARAAFRGLLKSGDISGPVGRLATIAARSQAQAPLQITVQPRGQDR